MISAKNDFDGNVSSGPLEWSYMSTTQRKLSKSDSFPNLSPTSMLQISPIPNQTPSPIAPIAVVHVNKSIDAPSTSSNIANETLQRRYRATVQLLSESLEEASNMKSILELTADASVYEPILRNEVLCLAARLDGSTPEKAVEELSVELSQAIKIKSLLSEKIRLVEQLVELRSSLEESNRCRERLEGELRVSQELLAASHADNDKLSLELDTYRSERLASTVRTSCGTPPAARSKLRTRLFNFVDEEVPDITFAEVINDMGGENSHKFENPASETDGSVASDVILNRRQELDDLLGYLPEKSSALSLNDLSQLDDDDLATEDISLGGSSHSGSDVDDEDENYTSNASILSHGILGVAPPQKSVSPNHKPFSVTEDPRWTVEIGLSDGIVEIVQLAPDINPVVCYFSPLPLSKYSY